ncbi:MAG: SDR family oxidoreductase [Flavobacteriaceae bacterium]|jgi:L-fucose dehydrogenase|nr:SDR family oxidoreductase [Flavobacteriaceae bacterium]MBL6692906.1 SDR family oxidoreductase [Flavobacteriaceae bacterium]|tara:strand:- start:2956 stop:3741 length:786 start_codon:yes stop_codon:yes gene_type:complete
MDLKLQEKIILVTGGSKGIGHAISHVLAADGAIPFIVSRDEKSILQTKEEIEKKGGKCAFAIAELTDPEQCKRAVEKAISLYGTLHGLVNNAGVNDGVGLENGNAEDFVLSLKKNVVHYFVMAQACLPYLKQNKGAIVNIGSKVSVTGQGGTSAYAAACGGRNALTREWAVELLPYAVRVNGVMVAESYTPLYEKWINTFPNPQEKLDQIETKIPLEKRMTTPEEIANTVAFLMSEKSSHTTGQLIYVDGGYVHLDRSINP